LRRRLTTAGVASLMAAAIAGCGSSSNTPVVQAGPHIGTRVELADCHDWEQSSTEERLGTLGQLKTFAGGTISGGSATAPTGRGAVLDDKKAYDLLNDACGNQFAAGFKLYKLYERAAAFAGAPAQ
jgi:hypothetical protein